MLGNFFNNFYYGKAGKSDFNPENLPVSRVSLFFQMLRIHWGQLVKLNLLYLLFCLPAVLWTGWSFLALEGTLGAVQAGEMAAEALSDQVNGIVWLWLLILCPCIAITGPATAGVSFVARNWARDEHSFMFSDFKDAFRENWKQALIVSVISGVLPVVLYVCFRFYGSMAAGKGMLFMIPQTFTVIVGILWLLLLETVYMMMVTYKLTFKNLLRNALILSVGRLPHAFVIRLASLWLIALAIVVSLVFPVAANYALLAVILYYLVFGFAFDQFLFCSFANAVCEKYMNPRIEGAKVGMGLRQTTEDDYEIDPTLPQPGEDRDEP